MHATSMPDGAQVVFPAVQGPGGPGGNGSGGPLRRGPPRGWRRAVVGQTAEPAFHCDQGMFQPLRPLSGWMTLSLEFLTTTTSPMRELS